MSELAAPIVGVMVYPDQARVTRRGQVAVPAGQTTVVLDGLPLALVEESVRVSGRGAGARLVGVDVSTRHHVDAPDPLILELEERLRALQDDDRAALDAEAADALERSFLERLARRGGDSLARVLAAGDAEASQVAELGATLRERLDAVNARSRETRARRHDLAREIAALEATLADRRQQRQAARRMVTITVDAERDTGIELDVGYVVGQAGWRPAYDAHVDDERVTLDWQGLVTQRTGEDWPAVDLRLSTARAAVRRTIPELDPWYLDAWVPPAPITRRAMLSATARTESATPADAVDVADVDLAPAPPASAEAGTTAMSYRLTHPVAVAADGSPHRATIARLTLEARLDFVAVPKLAAEAYLRATIVNTSGHTLLPGTVSVFSDGEFVGTTEVELVASGAELELQLGVDDRVTVERELTRRETSKSLVGGNRRTAVTWTTTVQNHRPAAARVTVLDQFPVSRHEEVKVKDAKATPEPAERSDLDVVTWRFELAPGETRELALTFTVEHPKAMQLSGWT